MHINVTFRQGHGAISFLMAYGFDFDAFVRQDGDNMSLSSIHINSSNFKILLFEGYKNFEEGYCLGKKGNENYNNISAFPLFLCILGSAKEVDTFITSHETYLTFGRIL